MSNTKQNQNDNNRKTLTINGYTFTEYVKYNTKQSGYTCYIYEFKDGKYYVGMTKQRISKRLTEIARPRPFYSIEGRTHYGYSMSVTELIKNNQIKTIYLFTGIQSEQLARDIETQTIRALKATNPRYGYNKRESDPPAREIKQLDPITKQVLKVHKSIKSAMHSLGKGGANPIRLALKGERKTAFGFAWSV